MAGPRPQRLVLSRRKGFDLQAQSRALNGLPAQRVTRPGPWGNPFVIAEVAERFGLDAVAGQAKAIALYRQWMDGSLDPALSPGEPPRIADIRAQLAGKNLACWCRIGDPCHADTLVELANEREET